jgi:hypothetical protein
MGEATDDDAPTGVAPTELGATINETQARTAWSLDDGEDWPPPPRRLTPEWITFIAVAASIALVAVAAVVAFVYLRQGAVPASSVVTSTSTALATSVPPEATTQPPAPAPAPTRSQPPAPVTLPMDPYGSVHVRTVSGRTVCAMTAGDVGCNVHFNKPLGPNDNGMPSSGVGITARGAFQWLYGDPGDPDYVTMAYGTVYSAIGWTITPTSDGTTFVNDATGHGMTVTVEGVSTF